MNISFNYYRKIWHLSGLIFPLILFLDPLQSFRHLHPDPTRAILIVFLAFFALFWFFCDLARFNSPAFAAFFHKTLGIFMKHEEKDRFTGTIPYLTANLFLLLFFSKEVVIISSILLALGDPAAAYIGGHYGKRRLSNGKSAEGLIAFIAAGFFASLAFIVLNGAVYPSSLLRFGGSIAAFFVVLLIFLGALSAGIGEMFSFSALHGLVDDNFIVPITGALGLVLAGTLLPGISTGDLIADPRALFLFR